MKLQSLSSEAQLTFYVHFGSIYLIMIYYTLKIKENPQKVTKWDFYLHLDLNGKNL